MAVTAGVIDGTLLRITSGGNEIAYATSCNFDRSRSTTTRVHKDLTSGQAEVKVNEDTTTVTVDGFVNYDGTNNSIDVLNTAYAAKTSLTMELTTGVTDDTEWQFSAICTALSITAEAQQDSTFSATFIVDGAVTQAVIV